MRVKGGGGEKGGEREVRQRERENGLKQYEKVKKRREGRQNEKREVR